MPVLNIDAKQWAEDQKKLFENKSIEVECPDCGATLRIESDNPLPQDIKVVFVEHKC